MTSAPLPTITPQQKAELDAARLAFRRLGWAATYATCEAWTIGVMGTLTFLFGLLSGPDPMGLMLGAGMIYCAIVEHRAAASLRKLDPKAPSQMSNSQMALGGMLIVYAIYSLLCAFMGKSELAAELEQSQFSSVLGPGGSESIRQLELLINIVIYSLLILFGLFVQGGTAYYYATRRKYLADYLQTTSPWLIELQRAGMRL